MEPVERLIAIEAIKDLKARYWYAIDTKDWDGLRDVFTEDAIMDMRPDRDMPKGIAPDELEPVETAIAAGDEAVIVGNDNIVKLMKDAMDTWTTFHMGHPPIIEFQDHDRATGIWPILDYIDDGERALKSYGHYHDGYRFVDGRWQVCLQVVIRIRADGENPEVLPWEDPQRVESGV